MSGPGIGERSYAYAKACGIIGASFVGKRITKLAGLSRLTVLNHLVFPQEVRELPERELLVDLEDRIIRRGVRQITAVANAFTNPPELLVRLIRTYEYEDLKTALGALAKGEMKNPGFTDIGRFRTVAFESYPDLKAMLQKTEFAFLIPKRDTDETGWYTRLGGIAVQTKLDHHYYTSLWKAMLDLKKTDRIITEKILSEEISLRNAVWALRLRTYYAMSPKEIQEKFIVIKNKEFLTGPATSSLSMALDHHGDWTGWKWARFLNPENPPNPWRADPRHFQNAASQYLYRFARYSFRRRPFSLDSIFCFIKLKQFEEDLLTSVTEGLGMGMSSQDIFALLEVKS
jgi:vacuolar-type H+-ATPase subunit C/Vma6